MAATASQVHQYAYLEARLPCDDDMLSTKPVRRGDAVWDLLDGKRARLGRVVDRDTLELLDDETGAVLPDYRHVSQVQAY